MRRKIITALSLVLVFSVLFGNQIATTASARTSRLPLTAPLTFFQITGKITNKIFSFLPRSTQFQPAAGVTVTAENIFSRHTFQTTTDSNGNYVLPVDESGVYLVTPSSGSANFYAPPVRSVSAKKSGGTAANVNFQGYKFP